MVKVTHQCCFCGNNIEETHKLDPCAVAIYSNLDKEIDEQLEQMFFCHYECFRMAMDAGTRVHLNLEDQVVEKPYFKANRE